MSFADLAGDGWRFIEGIEDVTLQPKNPDASPVGGIKSLRQPITPDQLFNGQIGIDPRTTIWHLWRSTMQGLVPSNGHIMVCDDKTEWTIQSAGFSARSGRYICTALQRA